MVQAPEHLSGRGVHESDPQLSDVLANLEPDVLHLAAGPDDAIPISDVMVADGADIGAVAAGSIVLAVGCSCEGDALAALLEGAAQRRAAAIVIRADRAPGKRIDELATRSGIALLGVSGDVRWDHVHSLVRTAIATSRSKLPAEEGVAIGDLFGLADAIASAVGGPVTIEDPHWRLLAYANLDYELDRARQDTILGRTPPAAWQQRLRETGVPEALRSSDEVFRFRGSTEDGFATRLVAPVRVGDELLGSLWVAEAGSPLDAAAERELAGAAQVAAVHLLSHRASEDIKRRTRGAFVREVLEGWSPSDAGIGMMRASGPFTVVVFAVDEEAQDTASLNPERLLSVVSLYCESRYPDAMCALIEDRVWAVLPGMLPNARETTHRLAERVLDRVEASLGVRLAAAIGTTVPGVADIPESRRAAIQALTVLMRRRTPARFVHIEDVRAHTILFEILDWASGKEELARGKLDKLVVHDRERKTSYRETLRVYLDVWGDIRTAADRLSIHPNTLRYRLQRLTEISGLDLDDPDERLVTELQLRML